MDRVERYIKELSSTTTLMRKFAARNLNRDWDDRAYGPMLHALDDPEPAVRLEVVQTLSDRGDSTAISPLEAAAKQYPDLEQAVEKAVKAIRSRVEPRPVAPGPSAVTPPSDPQTAVHSRRQFIVDALKDTEAEIGDRPYGFKVRINLVNGRTQDVRIVFDRADPEGASMILLYTVCAPADASKFRWALRANTRLAFGALGLREVRGKEQFILTETVLERGATMEELRKKVLSLAEKGDQVEKQFTGKDRY